MTDTLDPATTTDDLPSRRPERQPVPRRRPRTRDRGGHRVRPPDDRADPRRAGRPLAAQRTEPRNARRPVDASLVHGRRDGPRRPPGRRKRRVVPQPLGPRRRRPCGGHVRCEHQRRRVRRHHVGDGRRRQPADRTRLRTRLDGPEPFQRHARRPVHRAPEVRPVDRRTPLDELPLARPDRPRQLHRRRRRRSGHEEPRDPGQRHADDARHVAHRDLRRHLRPVGDRQLRRARCRLRLPVQVGRRPPRPRRPPPARRHR